MKLRLTPARVYQRATALLRTDPASVRSGFIALVLSTCAGLVAGLVLGSITDTLIALPGLVVLAPAAIGLRGNVFGALASRLSTQAQLGELNFSRRLSSIMGQNLVAATILSISCSFILAAVAKIVSEAFGISNVISFIDFFVISIIGSIIPTIVVMIVTVLLAKMCIKRDWDLDNVAAPIVTATGDMVTIPSLVLATVFVGIAWVTPVIAILSVGLAGALLVAGFISRFDLIKQVVRQSLPILILGGTISILAGLTVQGSLDSLSEYPIFLVMIPPLLSINGAIASILSARISTKLHLGIVNADRFGISPISEDVTLSYLLTVPVFFILGVFCSTYSIFGHLAGPGFFLVIAVAVIAGTVATTLSNFVGYITAIMTYRFGFDPDNFAVPAVTSISDLIGAIVLIITIGILHA